MTVPPRERVPLDGRLSLGLAKVREVAGLVVRSAEHGLGSAEAARAAFFLSVASVPAIMFIFTLAALFGTEAALESFVRSIVSELPAQAGEILSKLVGEVKSASTPGFLSLSAILSIWGASSVIDSLSHGVNRAYRVKKRRPWWRKKGLALLLLFGNSAFLIAGSVVVLAGPRLALALGLESLAGNLRWPLIWLGMAVELCFLFYLLPVPDHPRSGRGIVSGAVLGTLVWVLGTLLFRFYVRRLGGHTVVYGVLGGILVWMLWLYLSAAAVFLGADVAAALERRAARTAAS